MSTLLELPSEVHQFLSRPTPQTLLIRGAPGSGKSTLALALLQNFQGRRFYVSSRVSREALVRDHPWLSTDSGITIIDTASRRDTLAEAARILRHARELIENPEKEPELEGLWLPAPIQEVYAEVRPTEPLIAIVDSWDALVEKYLGAPRVDVHSSPNRGELERLVLDQMARGPIFLVLVLEQEATSQLDYLADGVVVTKWESNAGRSERWVHLPKLRGTRIDHAAYPFTLEGGKFQCILPLPVHMPIRLRPGDTEPNPQPGYLWPGSTDFARAFGRLQLNSLSTFGRENSVPTSAIRLILNATVAQVLRGGGRVVHILPPNISLQEVWRSYLEFTDAPTLQRQVRFQVTALGQNLPEELVPVILTPPVQGADHSSPRTLQALRFLKESANGSPHLLLVWVTGLRALAATHGITYSTESLPGIALQYISHPLVHAIFVGLQGDPLLDSLKPIASLQLRFTSRSGRVFVFGEDPPTPSFVLSEGDDSTPFRLLRIV